MIMRRVLKLIRRHFHHTHTLVPGAGHRSLQRPELMGSIDSMPNTGFILGSSCNAKAARGR